MSLGTHSQIWDALLTVTIFLGWFIDGQRVLSDAYCERSKQDPVYQNALVSGEPAHATRGPGKKKACVLAQIHRIWIR
jgi:hypothetical protein